MPKRNRVGLPCEGCGNKINTCFYATTCCGRARCEDCIDKIFVNCPVCNDSFCPDCFKETKCSYCGKFHLHCQCMKNSCEICEKFICKTCQETLVDCHVCGKKVCTPCCIHDTCDYCGEEDKYICKSCEETGGIYCVCVNTAYCDSPHCLAHMEICDMCKQLFYEKCLQVRKVEKVKKLVCELCSYQIK